MVDLTEEYFLKRGFKKKKNYGNALFLRYNDYKSFGVFNGMLAVEKTKDGHNWKLHTTCDLNHFITLIKFCNKEVFERFIGMLLIEFKEI